LLHNHLAQSTQSEDAKHTKPLVKTYQLPKQTNQNQKKISANQRSIRANQRHS